VLRARLSGSVFRWAACEAWLMTGGEVYFVGFRAGVEARGGSKTMLNALEPFAHFGLEAEFGFVPLSTGGADMAQLERTGSAVLVRDVTVPVVWDALFEGARAAGWVGMPTGGRVCLTAESQRAELPAEFQADAVVVASGAELMAIAGQ